jgi:hypothetical protein
MPSQAAAGMARAAANAPTARPFKKGGEVKPMPRNRDEGSSSLSRGSIFSKGNPGTGDAKPMPRNRGQQVSAEMHARNAARKAARPGAKDSGFSNNLPPMKKPPSDRGLPISGLPGKPSNDLPISRPPGRGRPVRDPNAPGGGMTNWKPPRGGELPKYGDATAGSGVAVKKLRKGGMVKRGKKGC